MNTYLFRTSKGSDEEGSTSEGEATRKRQHIGGRSDEEKATRRREAMRKATRRREAMRKANTSKGSDEEGNTSKGSDEEGNTSKGSDEEGNKACRQGVSRRRYDLFMSQSCLFWPKSPAIPAHS